ncbi:hypothetical protein [Limnoglobus roseus]|uniref:MoxR-vWA-beta-propeller ternary system domain-containing protein n=1 Tax=Limnoglobus roseus TaxID=2598579 RepID=A0A5C1AL10_9BACT|nr:hypothetical protein [Limnoglobus roseus]QEL19630.1 hypothetical protein PX52LOC_06706 [Limnoglobus roseus]
MPSFVDWLRRVVLMGESVQDAPPVLTESDRAAALPILRASFDRHLLEVAGPPLVFDAATAVWAAEALAAACWELVAGDVGESAAGREPRTPGEHLTADVLLRFLPPVYRRAKARDAAGPLARRLETMLRRWPLSGVLLDLDGSPTTPSDFAGHPGLQLLYAERLVANPRSGWLPPAGPGRDWAERIFEERGRPLPREPTGDVPL